ncbi:NmrA family NAD(P)-binding protein [Neolewinella sp.]|uniref:NmrA family NAD(P)-binding protein n=1 Tax=Neolewinella sp. TaxID=2993543 RepID=UPI003B5161C6
MSSVNAPSSPIILAGATGNLGRQIGQTILQVGGTLRAIVRPGTAAERTADLRNAGAEIREADFTKVTELTEACRGGSCVVSALAGLRKTIVDTQTNLLEAAVDAGVPRFIPSDFSIDFTHLPRGTNRNLDLRREFHGILNAAPIRATSVLNGMFADLLTGEAPLVLQKINRVLYWGDADQPLDFTTIANTADYTALAALDTDTPRYLRVAGDTLTPRQLADAATEAFGKTYKVLWAGGIGALTTLIDVARLVAPGRDQTYPAWQGMQYMRNMLSGRAKLYDLNNDRYPAIRWTRVAEVLAGTVPEQLTPELSL